MSSRLSPFALSFGADQPRFDTGHPEWDERILLPLIEGYEADGAFDAEFAAAAKKRAQDHHDGKVLGRALLKVLGVGLE